MGQKVHPYGVRLGYTKNWKSKWFAKKDYKRMLLEDLKMRKVLKPLLKSSAVASVDIERSSGKIRLKIYSARPGVIIGRKGAEIDKLKDALEDITQEQVHVDIKEIKNPQIHAQLIAENVANQLERRVAFRRAMKKSITACMTKGADGMKIQVSGRLGGAEIARTEGYKEGKVPLSTFRANVDYGFTEANTTYGLIGIKVWVYSSENLFEMEDTMTLEKGAVKEESEPKKTPRRPAKKAVKKEAEATEAAKKE